MRTAPRSSLCRRRPNFVATQALFIGRYLEPESGGLWSPGKTGTRFPGARGARRSPTIRTATAFVQVMDAFRRGPDALRRPLYASRSTCHIGRMAEEKKRELPEPGMPIAKVDCLYRIYGAKDEMPPLEKLLARLTSGNPYNPPGSFIFPPGRGMRRLQDALGASRDFSVMGYSRAEKPEVFAELEAALPAQAHGFEDHDRTIAREAKICAELRAEIENPENNEFVETLVHLADALRDLLHGVVWDVRMGKVFGHEEWRACVMEEPFSVLNHVTIAAEGGAARTRGLVKFGSPELEILSVPADVADDVANVLLDFAEHISQGDLVEEGVVIDYTHARLRFAAGPSPDVLRIADDADEKDGAAGAPKLYEGLRAARRATEGRRAGGGRGAED